MGKTTSILSTSILGVLLAGGSAPVAADAPGYEPAYYNGDIVIINEIEVQQSDGALEHAAADFYQVVYPTDQSLWPSDPLCNPCDHDENGIDPTDFHDHVLDSIPRSPGHGEFNPLWRVFVILPAPGLDSDYANRLPMESEEEVEKAVDDGIALKIDTEFYFLCSVVDEHALRPLRLSR
jgi:hypothetical protein